MSPQLPLALGFPPDQRFSSFLGNSACAAWVATLAQGELGDGGYLAGPAGSGKTHLLLAACAEAQARGRAVMYLLLASVAGHLAEALAAREGVALVCLDGLEAIAGQREDEVALFHFHNRARAGGAALLYAARLPPAGLALSLPDFASRLGQCTQMLLESLDEAGRRDVLRERAARRGLELDEAALNYLFARVGRDLVSLSALLDRLDRASLAAQRRLTVPFLRGVLESAQ